jgi:hypothetical protein
MTYDPARNGADCYELAITYLRLKGIKDGKFQPRPQCSVEMAVAQGLEPCSLLTPHGFVCPTSLEPRPMD